MSVKLVLILILIVILSLLLFVSLGICRDVDESGSYSIYFMDEKVGYEEFVWRAVSDGYELEVTGQITKPVSMHIEHLVIQLTEEFIPLYYEFKGSISGSEQSVSSTISDGSVVNRIRAAGQERESTKQIRRDAFLLPNPVFSPYMVITKKYRCSLQEEKTGLYAYIIPQAETTFVLSPGEEDVCLLLMEIGATVIELETDKGGTLKSLHNPSQNIRVVLD
jgi:hypothetical protein